MASKSTLWLVIMINTEFKACNNGQHRDIKVCSKPCSNGQQGTLTLLVMANKSAFNACGTGGQAISDLYHKCGHNPRAAPCS